MRLFRDGNGNFEFTVVMYHPLAGDMILHLYQYSTVDAAVCVDPAKYSPTANLKSCADEYYYVVS